VEQVAKNMAAIVETVNELVLGQLQAHLTPLTSSW